MHGHDFPNEWPHSQLLNSLGAWTQPYSPDQHLVVIARQRLLSNVAAGEANYPVHHVLQGVLVHCHVEQEVEEQRLQTAGVAQRRGRASRPNF